MVLGIHEDRSGDLPLVAQTGRLTGFLTCFREHWEEDRRQDGDNGDDHQQLNQREGGRNQFPGWTGKWSAWVHEAIVLHQIRMVKQFQPEMNGLSVI